LGAITDLVRDGARGVEVLARGVEGRNKWKLRARDRHADVEPGLGACVSFHRIPTRVMALIVVDVVGITYRVDSPNENPGWLV
jgi:hypothetical protein